MKILIIGASGKLARPVVRALDEWGHQVRLFSRSVDPSMFDKDFDTTRGDLFNPADLDKAMDGCEAVHISLDKVNEGDAVQMIMKVAGEKGIKLVSMISGCTVAEENRWFPMIENKFRAEQALINSGIPYMIFRASWFFETLDLMIRGGKATLLGSQPNPYHWVAADDYARMVSVAYSKQEARNRIFFVLGPEPWLMKDLLEKYCEVRHPEISKVSTAPLGFLKLMSSLTGNRELKHAVRLFAYFEKTKEMGDPAETDAMLGRAETTFEKWLELRN